MEHIAQLFKACGHPMRLFILNILSDGELCVCHIQSELGCEQSKLSKHLAVLRNAGLVETRRDGVKMMYSLTDERVARLIRLGSEVCQSRPVAVGE